jgi:hypothetical protein
MLSGDRRRDRRRDTSGKPYVRHQYRNLSIRLHSVLGRDVWHHLRPSRELLRLSKVLVDHCHIAGC